MRAFWPQTPKVEVVNGSFWRHLIVTAFKSGDNYPPPSGSLGRPTEVGDPNSQGRLIIWTNFQLCWKLGQNRRWNPHRFLVRKIDLIFRVFDHFWSSLGWLQTKFAQNWPVLKIGQFWSKWLIFWPGGCRGAVKFCHFGKIWPKFDMTNYLLKWYKIWSKIRKCGFFDHFILKWSIFDPTGQKLTIISAEAESMVNFTPVGAKLAILWFLAVFKLSKWPFFFWSFECPFWHQNGAPNGHFNYFWRF